VIGVEKSTIIGKYENGDLVRVSKFTDREKTINVRGNLIIVCNKNGLAIRDVPDLTLQDAWYKTAKGWITAYRVKGKVTASKINKSWNESYGHVCEEIAKPIK